MFVSTETKSAHQTICWKSALMLCFLWFQRSILPTWTFDVLTVHRVRNRTDAWQQQARDGSTAAALILRPELMRHILDQLHWSETQSWSHNVYLNRFFFIIIPELQRNVVSLSDPLWLNTLNIVASETWLSFEWGFCSFACRRRICVCSNHDTRRMITKET